MTKESLRQILAGLGKADTSKITDNTNLTTFLGGSLGRARLDAALRAKTGMPAPAAYKSATFGDLCQTLGMPASSNGNSPNITSTPAWRALSAAPGSVKIGIDIEVIAALPDASDYWEHEFYKATFTPREIAYAISRPAPKASFAAIWCAKEALRKAEPMLADTSWQRMDVVHTEAGKPELLVDGEAGLGALSLSHTDDLAIGVFVIAKLATAISSNALPAPAPVVRGDSKIATAVAVLALLLSLASVALNFLRH